MSRYIITESVGSHVEQVHRYEDLEKHHPSSGREPGRDYATVDGAVEEVRHVGSQTFVKKDMIFATDGDRPVNIPAPATGYVHYLPPPNPTNAVRIYDRAFGEPGAVMLAQVLHMRRGTSPPEGAVIEYGAPLGRMGDTGSPGSIHAHIEMEPERFRRYIRDIDHGAITPDRHPSRSQAPSSEMDPIANGVLQQGENGAGVRTLQHRLHDLGVHDAHGGAIAVDGEFGTATAEAVRGFQRTRGLQVDGVAGPATFAALQTNPTPRTPTPASAQSSGDFGPTPLSDLIGRGEGGYNAYNRGHAGDSGGAQIDFSQLTVAEVMRRQGLPRSDGQSLFAVGKFQMIPGTMRDGVQHLHIDPAAHFTPALQERMFAGYLVDGKRPAVHAYITGEGGVQALGAAQLALAQEFASVASPRTGRSYYDGDSAGNHSSISANETRQALERMRELFRGNVARGLAPEQAYAVIGGGATQPRSDTHAPAPTLADGVVRRGEHGDDVRRVQQLLRTQGYTDARGRAIALDSDFGPHTEEAVRSLQRARHLSVDGIVGPDTLAALRAPHAPSHAHSGTVDDAKSRTSRHGDAALLVSDPAHPDARLHAQAIAAMDRLEATIGRKHDATTDRAAAALVVAARRGGLASIDHVLLSDDGGRLFAVQGEPGSPLSRMAFVDTANVTRQSVETSTRELAGIAPGGAVITTAQPAPRALAF